MLLIFQVTNIKKKNSDRKKGEKKENKSVKKRKSDSNIDSHQEVASIPAKVKKSVLSVLKKNNKKIAKTEEGTSDVSKKSTRGRVLKTKKVHDM